LLVVQYLLAGSSLDAMVEDETAWRPSRVLVVTAHPDDETMFFAPAILRLRSQGVDVSGLCLTVGDAQGLGDARRGELLSAYETLGVSREWVSAVDDPNLPDGMQAHWPQERVVYHISRHVQEHGPFDTVLTFDQTGVTHHANHVACYEAVRMFVSEVFGTEGMQAFALRSLPVMTKFGGLPAALWRHIWFRSRDLTLARYTPGLLQPASLRSLPPDRISFLSSPLAYYTALRAMAKHRSQLVWFRYLYVIFSGYMFNVQFEAIV
jgi:N-acetylglucosaminylphosphatidylinositol deacetylase